MHTEAEARRYGRRFLKPFTQLCEKAKVLPDTRKTAKELSDRTARFGRRVPVKRIEAILNAYEKSPHMCAVATWHDFGTPCRLGKRHPGCCPGCPGEDPSCW